MATKNEMKDNFSMLREIIKSGWVKGTYAMDKDDRPCSVLDVKACKFCLLGAVEKMEYDNHINMQEAILMWKMLSNEIDKSHEFEIDLNYYEIVHHYNDAPGIMHVDVLSMIDSVIESL